MSSLDCSKVKCTALNPITVLSNPCCKNAAHKRGQKTVNRKTVLEEGGPKLVKRIGEISGGVQKHVEEQGKQVEKNLGGGKDKGNDNGNGNGKEDPGKNEASGCPNPGEGDWVGQLWKPLCELGHGVQVGAEGGMGGLIPVAVMGLAIVLILQVMK